MATYYVSKEGSDANNGLGPDASHASNKPWLTIGKALGAAGIASGDTVWIGPGIYREQVTVAMTSAVAETFVTGDATNSKGFKTSGGVLVTAADVRWTAYTTNDTTAPSNQTTILNGRDFLTFTGITFVAGELGCIDATTAHSSNITFRRCVFLPGSATGTRAMNLTVTAGTAAVWVIDSCLIWAGLAAGGGLQVVAGAGGADYDLNIQIVNCVFQGQYNAYTIRLVGAASNKPGGIDIVNCTFISGYVIFSLETGGSTSIPCTFYNNYIISAYIALTATATGEIIEDWNIIHAAVPRTNTDAGSHSISDGTYSNLFELGQSALHGFLPKTVFSPLSGSPLLGFGGLTPPSTDILNRPRPSGGASTSTAAGCFERHDFGTREASVVDASTYALKLTGPGDQEIRIPVAAASTTISIRVRYDTNHGTGSKPQAILLDAPQIGVATETKTAAAGVDTWETLTFSAITPTAASWVTLRLISRSAAANGIAYFDTVAVA